MSNQVDFTEVQFRQAADRLAVYIQDRSEKIAAEIGFSWFATDRAPNTYPALVAAWERSCATGAALPISSLNSDDVVFPNPIDNIRFRFYHDCKHMLTGLTFDAEDEVKMAQLHIDEARTFLPADSLEMRIYEADTMGQAMMLYKARRFAYDQAAFAKDVIRFGIDSAIERDINRAVVDTTT